MNKNIGNIDKAIRIIIALFIGALYFTDIISGTLGTVLVALAGIFILTSAIGVCPLYLPFGINTCPNKK